MKKMMLISLGMLMLLSACNAVQEVGSNPWDSNPNSSASQKKSQQPEDLN